MSTQKPTTNQSSQATTAKASAGASKKKVSKKKTASRTARAGARDTQQAVEKSTVRESAATAPVSAAPAAPSNGLLRLALIASLLAIVIASYAAYQFTLSDSVSRSQMTALDERLGFAVSQQQSQQAALDQQNQVLTANNQKMSDSLAAMQLIVDALQSQSQQSADDLKANLGESVARWKLDELHSLLTRVNRAYQLTGDQARAIAGLKLAQASLATMDNPRLEAVSAALAEDILQVEAARKVDIMSLHNRLLGMSRRVPELGLVEDTRYQPEQEEQQAVAEAGEAAEDDSAIVAASKSLMDNIGGLVKYKNLEAPLQPSLDEMGRFVVYESLNLNLHAAMAALLRRDNAAYQSQLSLAESTLNSLFDLESGDVNTMLDQLEVMSSYDVSLNVDAVSQALAALDRVIVLEN